MVSHIRTYVRTLSRTHFEQTCPREHAVLQTTVHEALVFSKQVFYGLDFLDSFLHSSPLFIEHFCRYKGEDLLNKRKHARTEDHHTCSPSNEVGISRGGCTPSGSHLVNPHGGENLLDKAHVEYKSEDKLIPDY